MNVRRLQQRGRKKQASTAHTRDVVPDSISEGAAIRLLQPRGQNRVQVPKALCAHAAVEDCSHCLWALCPADVVERVQLRRVSFLSSADGEMMVDV